MHRPWRTKTITGAARAAALLLLAGNAWAQFAVSQQPVLSASPPANIVMLVDDSGSMRWAYVPDAYGACTGTRRFNAGTFNALAFNPNIVYEPPSIIDNTGTKVSLSTSFNAAWIDGFNTDTTNGAQAVDLSTSYQPTASSAPGTTSQTYSPHPGQDLASIGVGSSGGSVGSNCGISSTQFGPATGSGTLIPAAAYYYVYDSTQAAPQACSAPGTTVLTAPASALNDDNCYRYMAATSAPSVIDSHGNTIAGTQNFANWYSFYRTRHLMIISAASTAMADPVLTGARVTWRALN
jgi:type IV pilus assembly protein PilY1